MLAGQQAAASSSHDPAMTRQLDSFMNRKPKVGTFGGCVPRVPAASSPWSHAPSYARRGCDG
jgi:hypothetical protein